MVGETWNGFTTRLRNEPWSHAAEETKQEKQKAFLGSEKQNPPAEGALLVCLDFADVVIDGMTGASAGRARHTKRGPSTRLTATLTGSHNSLAQDSDPDRIVGFGRRQKRSPGAPRSKVTSRTLR